jgi:GDP-mannose 4,6-dehydratase
MNPSALPNLLARFWHHLSRRRQRQFVLLMGLMLVSAFAEVLSLGAVLPFLGILTAPERFVTQKIVRAACRIAAGQQKKLKLGNLAVQRDWGWAPEYVDAMWRMLQQGRADDYVIATGETSRLEDFVAEAFRLVGLDWRDHVESDPTLLRPTDLRVGRANPAKARERLGWTATSRMKDVVQQMVEAERVL